MSALMANPAGNLVLGALEKSAFDACVLPLFGHFHDPLFAL